MAIKQSITSVSGVTTEYHRISEAMLDFTKRKAIVVVLSYLGSSKRDEEKNQASREANLKELSDELHELVLIYDEATDTPELKARREELTNQVNALYEATPEDVEPRNLFRAEYDIEIPEGVDFTLEFAYDWLKEHIYTDSENC